MEYFKRDMESEIIKLSAQYPVLLLTGPRQVGKTTMLKNLLRGTERKYVSLDDVEALALAKEDPAMFFQVHKPPILIDEVQYAGELFSHIKKIVDETQRAGDFWLTGSQLFRLMDGVRESLAGRAALLNLFSLSQNEIERVGECVPYQNDFVWFEARERKKSRAEASEIYERIMRGGMPAVVSGKYTDSNVFYSSYVGTYIERDVRDISGNIDSLKFLKFTTAVACRCSQLLNYADIARDSDIDQSTVKNWLRILEALGIIFYLHPYSNNVLKRAIKTPKVYFHDSGLVAFLTKWSTPATLESGAMAGAIFENYVISEIYKSYTNCARTPFFYYYRDKDMNEIDLLLEMDGTLSPVEIKKTASPNKNMISRFKMTEKTGLRRGKGALVCMASSLSAFDSENYIVPVHLL